MNSATWRWLDLLLRRIGGNHNEKQLDCRNRRTPFWLWRRTKRSTSIGPDTVPNTPRVSRNNTPDPEDGDDRGAQDYTDSFGDGEDHAG